MLSASIGLLASELQRIDVWLWSDAENAWKLTAESWQPKPTRNGGVWRV